jgi:hypothetical protein
MVEFNMISSKPGSKPYKINHLRGGVDDIFYNTLDISWAKTAPGSPAQPKTWTKLPTEVAEDDGTVIYNLNDSYFRCDNFKKDHESEKHILFAGCSQTEGVGAQLETVWTKIVLNNINNKENSSHGFYSIGRSGFGWQKVITNFMVYADTYGIPEYLFVLLPNVGRFFEWHPETESFVYVQRYPNGGNQNNDQEEKSKVTDGTFIEKNFSDLEHKRSFIDFCISWKLFEKYCESVGTKVLWASWDYVENKNYEVANISKNYISLSEEGLMQYIASQRPDGKMQKFDIYRRDGHAGILVNEYWATEFQKEIEARGWL